MTRSWLLLAVGCGPASLGGEIDGEPVGGARDAFYDRITIDLGFLGSVDLLAVVLTDLPHGCSAISDIAESVTLGCDETCDRLDDAFVANELSAREYWTVALFANVGDGVAGDFDVDPELQDGEFTVDHRAWDFTSLESPAACEAACEAGDLLVPRSTLAESGTLTLLEDEEEEIAGQFEVALPGDGHLRGSFDAVPCEGQESWGIFLY